MAFVKLVSEMGGGKNYPMGQRVISGKLVERKGGRGRRGTTRGLGKERDPPSSGLGGGKKKKGKGGGK